MQLMVAAEVPADYVLATGISHRLSFFIARAFAAAGIQNWDGFCRHYRGQSTEQWTRTYLWVIAAERF